jgi:hypothetical protein
MTKAALLLLVGLGACTSNDSLPSGVTSSRTLTTTTDITTDTTALPPTTTFRVSVGTVDPSSSEVDDATVTIYADGAQSVDLRREQHFYEAMRTGYASTYSMFIRRGGQDYLEVDVDAPPIVAIVSEPHGVGQPVTLTWLGVDPTLFFTVSVKHNGTDLPISGQALGANPDDGTYELPGLTFGEPGQYTVSVQRTRWIHWADPFECEHECAALSSVRANTISSATFTL